MQPKLLAHSLIKVKFTNTAHKSQETSQKVEYKNLVSLQNPCVKCSWPGMQHQVSIRADGIHRGIFPRLKALSVDEVVCWFPVVECFITVRDVAQKGCTQPRREQTLEGSGSFRGPDLPCFISRPAQKEKAKSLVLSGRSCWEN